MVEGFRVIIKSLKDIWGEMFMLVLMNLFTLLCQLVIIPGPPAMAALYAMCNRVANDYAISWDNYFDAFKKYFKKSWIYAVFSIVITALLVVNFIWYGQQFGDQPWAAWVQGAWLAATFFWLVINFYTYPFLMEQEDKRLRVALRNAALVAGANPLFTLIIIIIVGVLMVISIVITPVFVLLGFAIYALFGSEAVVNRVNAYRKRLEAAEGDAKNKPRKI